jgi:hypothetical protein
MLAFAAASSLLVTIGARQAQDLVLSNATVIDWGATLVVALAGWWAFALAARALVRTEPSRDPLPAWLTLLLLLAAAYVCLGLVFAGRHRDFPTWLFLPGALAFATSAATHAAARAAELVRRRATEFLMLAAWVVTAGVLVPLQEGFANGRSLGWGALCVLLGSAILLPLALQSRQHERPAEHADA